MDALHTPYARRLASVAGVASMIHMNQRFMRIAAIVNFAVVSGAMTFWYTSCRTSTNQALPNPAPSNATTIKPMTTSANAAPVLRVIAPQLTTFDAIAACLDRHGGIVGGACVAPATVAGVELGAQPNDQYFAASKAAPAISWSSGKDAVNAIQDLCARQQGAAQKGTDVACVLQYLQDRTTPAPTSESAK